MDYLIADIVWRPLIGARWIWVISAAHLFACWLCFQAGRQKRLNPDGKPDSFAPTFWNLLGVFMFVLFLNKFLDLQSLITISMRNYAKSGGWLSDRRTFQVAFVAASAAIGGICLAVCVFVLRRRWRQCGLACSAAVFLLTLITIRTASYNPIDTLLYHLPLIGNRTNAGLELAGALLVCLGAWQASPRQRVTDSNLNLSSNQNTPT